MYANMLHWPPFYENAKIMILVSRLTFLRLQNPILPFILINDLDLLRLWPLQNHILCHISVITGQNIATFGQQVAYAKAYIEMKKYPSQIRVPVPGV